MQQSLLNSSVLDLSHTAWSVQMTSSFCQRVKKFPAYPYNYDFSLHEIFLTKHIQLEYFTNLRYSSLYRRNSLQCWCLSFLLWLSRPPLACSMQTEVEDLVHFIKWEMTLPTYVGPNHFHCSTDKSTFGILVLAKSHELAFRPTFIANISSPAAGLLDLLWSSDVQQLEAGAFTTQSIYTHCWGLVDTVYFILPKQSKNASEKNGPQSSSEDPSPPLSTLVDTDICLVIDYTRSSTFIFAYCEGSKTEWMERPGNKVTDIMHLFSGSKLQYNHG